MAGVGSHSRGEDRQPAHGQLPRQLRWVRIAWNDADCGYGVSQLTDGMPYHTIQQYDRIKPAAP